MGIGLVEWVVVVSVAMYGHAKVEGMGLKGIWKMSAWCGVKRESMIDEI